MVIDAAEIFRCTHSYIGAPRSSPFMFVCHRCGHRAEFLPLHLPGTSDTHLQFQPVERPHCGRSESEP
jgi:hypothetical protein